jgi:response regulator RpfG family c-di-GMP phosphodiesterase
MKGRKEMTRETIMFVDDEVNVLNSLRRLFRKEGYEILTCTSGEEALKLLEDKDVQVLIADQRMPHMTGTELLKIVKDRYPLIIRIILSGYSDIEDIIEAINEGEIYRFLRKPNDLTDLRQIVEHALEQSRLLRKVHDLGKALQDQVETASYHFKTSYTGGMVKVELNGENHLISQERVVGILKSMLDQAIKEMDLDIIGGILVRQKGRMTLYADLGSGFQLAFELPIEQSNG